MQKVLTKQCQYFLIFDAEICSVTNICLEWPPYPPAVQGLQTSNGWNSNSFPDRFPAFSAQKYLFLVHLFYRPIGIVH